MQPGLDFDSCKVCRVSLVKIITRVALEVFGVREVRTDPGVLLHAIADGINVYVRDVLAPRCPAVAALWDGPAGEELARLKYEVAAAVATQWAESQVNDEA